MVDWRAIGAIMSVGMFVIAAMTVIGLVQLQEGIPSPGFFLEDGTTTVRKYNAGWKGVGSFPGPEGDQEIFSRSAFVLPHTPNGESYDIVFAGEIGRIDWFACGVQDMEFRLDHSIDGRTWKEWKVFSVDTLHDWGNTKRTEPIRTNIIGNKMEGALRVSFMLQCDLDWGHEQMYRMATDWAYLRSDEHAKITATDQATVGETIDVKWTIPYVAAYEETDEEPGGAEGPGWYLSGTHLGLEGDDATILYKKPLTTLTGIWSYVVQTKDFVPGVGGVCNPNIIEWTLHSEVRPNDWDWTTTIDIEGGGPVVKDLKFDKSTYKIGDTATFTWKSEPGPLGFSVYEHRIGWGYTEPEAFVKLSGNVSSFTTQPLSEAGELEAKVVAYDTACRASAPGKIYIQVADPTTEGDEPPPPDDSIVWAFALLFAVLLSIIILYVVSQFVQVGGWINYVILAVIWLAVAIPLYYGLLIVFEAVEALI